MFDPTTPPRGGVFNPFDIYVPYMCIYVYTHPHVCAYHIFGYGHRVYIFSVFLRRKGVSTGGMVLRARSDKSIQASNHSYF